MNKEDQLLDMLQQVLLKLHDMDTRLQVLEKSKETTDNFQMNMAIFMSELKSTIEITEHRVL
ncbi:MAG: hypothetical protein ACTJHC_05380 [Vagococcus sp.]